VRVDQTAHDDQLLPGQFKINVLNFLKVIFIYAKRLTLLKAGNESVCALQRKTSYPKKHLFGSAFSEKNLSYS
jgi:hypothetical protein